MRLIEHCSKKSIRLIYETDDDLFNLPEDHPEFEVYRNSIETAKVIAQHADAITVSTQPLQAALAVFGKPVFVIPNWLDERLWSAIAPSQSASDGRIRALYAGSVSHLPDLALLEDPVRRLKRNFDFELNIVGVTNQEGANPWFHSIPVVWWASWSYLQFVKWLPSAGNWDVGLAPLQAGSFMASKSGIKVYEYAALGLPTVASCVPAYESVVRHQETGLLVRNSAEAWYAALRELCESQDVLNKLKANTKNAMRSYTLGDHAPELAALWNQALFGEG
jgi:glycosyltransferase involved in cell wall biosynthesis